MEKEENSVNAVYRVMLPESSDSSWLAQTSSSSVGRESDSCTSPFSKLLLIVLPRIALSFPHSTLSVTHWEYFSTDKHH